MNEVVNTLRQYRVLTFYEEARDTSGKLLFCQGRSFSKVEVDDVTNYIVLSDGDEDNGCCMLDPMLRCKVIPFKNQRDEVILYSGNNTFRLFGKKN